MRNYTSIVRWAVTVALLTAWSAANALFPTNVLASRGAFSDRIDISWSHSVNTEPFTIYTNSTQNFAGSTRLASHISGSQRTYTYLVPSSQTGQNRYFFICTGADPQNCTPSGAAYTVADPYNTAATDGTLATSVQVTWTRGSFPPQEVNTGADYAYEVRRDGSFLGYVDNSNAYFNDTSATPGTTHTYQICARTFSNSGARVYLCSNTDTGFMPLQAPTGVTATDGLYAGKVEISYNLNGNPSVDIWRGTTKIASATTSNPYLDTLGLGDTLYSYKVCVSGATTCSATNGGHRIGPPPPINVVPDSAKVSVYWSAPVNVVSGITYDVYRYAGTTPTKIASKISGYSFIDTPPSVGVEYSYMVCTMGPSDPGTTPGAVDAAQCSNLANGTLLVLPPNNVVASDGVYATKVAINWTAGNNCSTMDIYRDSSRIASGISGTSYNDTTAQPGVIYQYLVGCANQSYRSLQGGVDSGFVMPPPESMTASDGTSSDHVRLTWIAGARVSSTFNVYRDDALITSSRGGEYLDTTATPGTVYTYKVCAQMSDGEACSVSDTGYRMGPPGESQVSATDGSVTNAITVSWTYAGAAVTSFEVMRSPTGLNNWTSVGSITDPAALAAGAASINVAETNTDPVTMYDFKVVATNGAGATESASDTGYANFAPTSVSGQFIALPRIGTTHTPLVVDPNSGDRWQISIETQGTKGTAVLTADGTGIIYTPNPDVTGSDTVIIRATDQVGASVTGTIEITLDCPDPVFLGVGLDASLRNLQGMVRLEACSQPETVQVSLQIVPGLHMPISVNLPIAPVAGTEKLFTYTSDIGSFPDGDYVATVTVADALGQTVVDAYPFSIDTHTAGAAGFTYKGGTVSGRVTIDSFGNLGVRP